MNNSLFLESSMHAQSKISIYRYKTWKHSYITYIMQFQMKRKYFDIVLLIIIRITENNMLRFFCSYSVSFSVSEIIYSDLKFVIAIIMSIEKHSRMDGFWKFVWFVFWIREETGLIFSFILDGMHATGGGFHNYSVQIDIWSQKRTHVLMIVNTSIISKLCPNES